MTPVRLLIIEDEPEVRRFLRAGLRIQGYRLIEAASGREGLVLLAQYLPDVVLLDLGLPDADGLDVLRQLREWSTVPVIVLSARGQERQKVEALDAGADDYLTKPFSLPELVARLRATLRRAAGGGARAPEGRIAVGPVDIDIDSHEVRVHGRATHLTPIEFRLLAVLARNAGRVVTQKQLIGEVWGPKAADRGDSLRVFMAHLRRKLQPRDGGARLFVTEPGVGYRLLVPEDEAAPPPP
jgi:two-component system KDP operon response regulator KdpE